MTAVLTALFIGMGIIGLLEFLAERSRRKQANKRLLAQNNDKQKRAETGHKMRESSKHKQFKNWKNENS